MEVTHPEADPASAWYATNGLLVTEMVSGRTQFGDDSSRGGCALWRTASPCPSGLPIAGDISSGVNQRVPRYGDFLPRLGRAESRIGQGIATTLARRNDYESDLVEGQDQGLATLATTIAVFDETTGHNIPLAFWRYMQGLPVDWLYTFGHPIAEPVWMRATVGGREQWVMVQLFERRTLTYTPRNPAEWQVEMGNVGQHYYQWRYGSAEVQPWE